MARDNLRHKGVLMQIMTLFLCFLSLACQNNGKSSTEVNADITVSPNRNSAQAGLSGFDRMSDVFGLAVYAENGVTDQQLVYVATVFAELLDNDEDGIIDDPAVHEQLLESQALMPIFANEGSAAEEYADVRVSGRWNQCCPLSW